MKGYVAVVVSLLAFCFSSPAVGQACYTPVTSWQGTYSWSGTGSGSDVFGEYSWTIDHQATGAPNLALSGASCSAVTFGGPDASATGSVLDFGTAKCGDGSPDTWGISGGPTFLTEGILSLDVEGKTFQYFEDPIVTGQNTTNTCGTVNTSSGPIQIAPFDAGCSGNLTLPKVSLPTSIQPLTGEIPFPGVSDCPFGVPSSFTLTYDLVPIFKDDDDCKKDGGSTVGCRNQSLGEDMGLVGTGMYLHYEGSRLTAAGADTVANNDALMNGGWTLSIHHAFNPASQTLYLGDGGQRNGYQLGVPVTYLGNTLITSESGDQVYVFSPAGQHLQTLRPLTGAVLYQFAYDSNGNLITVTDGSGNVITIKRNAAGHVTSIVSPYAQSTVLTMDVNGFLAQIKDPLGKLQAFTNTAAGQIIARTDANGNVYSYTYDNNGHLIKDADPVGGYHALTRTNATSGVGWTVAHATAMGMTSSYQNALTLPWAEDPNNPTFSEQQTNIWPDGLQATTSKSLQNGKLVKSVSLPEGESQSETTGPDPIWGMQAPVITAATLTKGSLTMHTTGSRAATLGSAGNPFSVATETDTLTANGRAYTSTFTGASLMSVNTSPAHRATTIVLDSQERVASTQTAGLTATTLAYTTKGELASITRGTRQTAFTYNSKGFLATASDPLKHKISLTYDADGRLLSTTLPDGRVVSHTYDANGNLLTVTPPGKSAHSFTYTGVDQVASYTPPGGTATTFAYDLDRRITSMVRPGGQTITYDYDTGGRLSKVVTPTATESFTYSGTTGNITSAVRGAERVSYSYNGSLLSKSTWTGTVAGNVSHVYNNNFWITSQAINGGTPVSYHYDNDGLLTAAGSLTVKRNATNGLITGTTLGLVSDTRT